MQRSGSFDEYAPQVGEHLIPEHFMGLNWHRPLMRNGYLRGRVATDLHSVATTIATTIDNEIEAALVGLDAEYAALCSELVLV